MTTRTNVPPSERDLAIYQQVKVEQRTTRQVAKITGISQTRICQIVESVGEFLIATAPAGEKNPQLQQQVNFARQLAGERIDHLIGVATRCFRKSKGRKETVRNVTREGETSKTVTTSRECEGDVQYLLAIARLAVIGSKLPTGGLARDWSAEEQAEDPSDRVSEPPKVMNTPSEGACSSKAGEQGVTPNAAVTDSNLKHSEKSTSVDANPQVAERKVAHNAPVQLAKSSDRRSPRKQFAREFFLEQLPPDLSPRAQAALNLE